MLNCASFSFDLSVADLYFSLCGGHTLFAAPSANDAVPLIRNERINAAVMTPTHARLCLLDPDFTADACPGFKCFYLCGEQLEVKTAAKLLRRFPALSLINAYGPTEATSAVCASVIRKEDLAGDLLPCGEVGSAACSVAVEDGEIVLRGDSVFGGYLGGEDGGHFTEGGVNGLRTGDLGSVENGKLYCRGRRDRQVKYKGYRIELDEIENCLLGVRGVSRCAVVAKRDPSGTVKQIRAFVCGDVTADGARRALEGILPPYMIPRTVTMLDELPQSGNGKTDRKKLEEL